MMNKFDSKKGRAEAGLWAKRAPVYEEEESPQMEMLFGVGLIFASDFGIGAGGVIQLTIRF